MAVERKREYNYQYGSTARKIESSVVVSPQPSLEPSKQPQKVIKPRINKAFCFQLSLCGILVFGAAFGFVHSYSALRSKQNTLIKIKNEIILTKSSISEAEAKITRALNLEYIRERAANELGMSEPLPHQTIYIDLPEQSYTSYGE